MGRIGPIETLEQYARHPEGMVAQISDESLNVLNKFIADHNNDVQKAAADLVRSSRSQCQSLLNLPKFKALGEMNYTDEVLVKRMVELLNTATFYGASQ